MEGTVYGSRIVEVYAASELAEKWVQKYSHVSFEFTVFVTLKMLVSMGKSPLNYFMFFCNCE